MTQTSKTNLATIYSKLHTAAHPELVEGVGGGRGPPLSLESKHLLASLHDKHRAPQPLIRRARPQPVFAGLELLSRVAVPLRCLLQLAREEEEVGEVLLPANQEVGATQLPVRGGGGRGGCVW